MRVTKMRSVYQLTFLPRLSPVNCYFIEDETGLILIDTGLPFSAAKIIALARRFGKPIQSIVLTHAHNDHVGGLVGLKKALEGVPVYISRRDARLLAADRSLDPDEPNTPIRGGVPKKPLPRPDVMLDEGNRIGSLVAVAAPGHTPGSFAFFDEQSRALIAGDAFQTQGGVAVSGTLQPLFPFPAWATWNKEHAVQSAKKLINLRPRLLAVGHGPMIEDPVDAMVRAVDEAERHIEMADEKRGV